MENYKKKSTIICKKCGRECFWNFNGYCVNCMDSITTKSEKHIDLVQISNQVYDAIIVCSAFVVFAQMIVLNTLLRTKQALYLSIFGCIAIYELVTTRHKKGDAK